MSTNDIDPKINHKKRPNSGDNNGSSESNENNTQTNSNTTQTNPIQTNPTQPSPRKRMKLTIKNPDELASCLDQTINYYYENMMIGD